MQTQYDNLSSLMAFVEILNSTADQVLKQVSSMTGCQSLTSSLAFATGPIRTKRVEQLTAIAEAYSAQATVLSSIEAKLRQQRLKLEVASAECYNSTCPMGSLPIEIIQEIILFAAPATNKHTVIPPLSLVCRFWRDAVAGVPSLWTNIRGRYENLEGLTVPLQRAKPHAAVTVRGDWNFPTWLRDKRLRDKVWSLSLSSGIIGITLSALTAFLLPNLIKLSITDERNSKPSGNPSRGNAKIAGSSFVISNRLMPRLQHFILDCQSLDSLKFNRTADTLRLFVLKNASVNLQKLLKMLRGAPNLDAIVFDHVTLKHDPSEQNLPNPALTDIARSIETVTFEMCDWAVMSCFLHHGLRHLGELKLEFPVDDPFEVAFDALGLGAIAGMSPRTSFCIELLQSGQRMDSLYSLIVSGPHSIIQTFAHLLTHDGNGNVFPILSHLELLVTDGHSCQTAAGPIPIGHHCACTIAESGVVHDVLAALKVFAERPLDDMRVSECLVEDEDAFYDFVEDVELVHCCCTHQLRPH